MRGGERETEQAGEGAHGTGARCVKRGGGAGQSMLSLQDALWVGMATVIYVNS